MASDFCLGFCSARDRLREEAAERAKLSGRLLRFGVSFLDDYCRGLLPHDLILIAARTGAGKTTLAEMIATGNAAAGKRVHYFALEAEPNEIERRLKFRWLAHRCYIDGFNYPDWYLGRFDDELGFLAAEADDTLGRDYATLQTYYKAAGDFGQADIHRLFLAIRNETDLIVLDHLHYVDTPDDVAENRAQKEIVKAIRDCALSIGVPIIVVAHMRKRAKRSQLLPEVEDVMGSSDIAKIATRAILLAPAKDQTAAQSYERPTYIQADKDRLCGNQATVALLQYDLRFSTYQDKYFLGYADAQGESWKLATGAIPSWAKHCANRS